mgnify:FL=1
MEKVIAVSWETDNGAGYEYFIDPALAKRFFGIKNEDPAVNDVYMEEVQVSCFDSDVIKSQVEHELYVGGV